MELVGTLRFAHPTFFAYIPGISIESTAFSRLMFFEMDVYDELR